MKVIIAPGNGCADIMTSNWYGSLHRDLVNLGYESICANFPDPYCARRSAWIPHLARLGADSGTVLVGHSSGAQAALRYAEANPLLAVVLVSATYTDLGDEGERASGYYPSADGTENRYDFGAMRDNCPTWHQMHSDDDPFIPVAEAERVRDGLGIGDGCYHFLPGRSHFFEYGDDIKEVVLSCLRGNK